MEPYISPLVIEEASRGDESASRLRLDKIAEFPVLEITSDVQELAESYFEKILIPNKARGDAFHLAVGTFHGMDFLVSWNFSHILNARVRSVIQEINTIREISTPIICTPEELMEV
ncbi:MAG: type II toxin-antitoxin system VapC family toxin [Thermodesulfobacteriota bacterium]|nr:type II toxin-antitoxin system VapC family toxin [Thermodesulfobacteriota bacterium]